MIRRLGLIVLILLIAGFADAKVKLHPTFTYVFSVTPHTAVSPTQYDTDYYNSIGASLDIVIQDRFTISPGYQFGVDVIADQVSTYSNPSLTLGYFFNAQVEERFKFSALFANAGGYHSQIYGLGTHLMPKPWLELEFTPQYFRDTINTQQIELDGDYDITLSKLFQLNFDTSIGRTFVSHLTDVTSYSLGAGVTASPKNHLNIFLMVEFAHGLNTDSPYSILNSTSTVNTQTGSRTTVPGNTALDPNGNTININIGTSLEF